MLNLVGHCNRSVNTIGNLILEKSIIPRNIVRTKLISKQERVDAGAVARPNWIWSLELTTTVYAFVRDVGASRCLDDDDNNSSRHAKLNGCCCSLNQRHDVALYLLLDTNGIDNENDDTIIVIRAVKQ